MIKPVTETEWITLKYETERVQEEEPLTAFHPNQGLSLGKDDYPKTRILLGSRGGEGVDGSACPCPYFLMRLSLQLQVKDEFVQ